MGTNSEKLGMLKLAGAETIDPLRSLLKSSGLYALSSVTLPLISLVLAPFLTHTLSPFDYGVLTVLNTSISLTAGITQLGLGSAFFRAYSYDYSSEHDRRAVTGTVVMLLCLVSLPLISLIVLTAPLLAGLLLGRSSLGNAVALAATALLLQNLTVPGFAWLRAESRALFYSLLSIGNLLVTLLANVILVGVLHMGLAGSLLATGCGYGCVLVCTLPWLLLRSLFSIRADIMRNLLSFGLPLVVSFLSTWVLQLSDRYLLSIFSSFAETAKYAVAYTLGSAMGVVVLGPFTLAWPTAVYAIAKREDASHIFKLVFRWFGLFLLFSTFALSLVGIIVLDLLFPASYHSGANIIPIVASSVAFYGIAYVFGAGTILTRKTWWSIIFTVVAAAVNVALNLALIPFFGAMGAAVSTLVAYVIYALIAYVVNQRIYPVPFETGIFFVALVIGVMLYIGSDTLGRRFGLYAAWAISAGTLIVYGGFLALLVGHLSGTRFGLRKIKALVGTYVMKDALKS
ncbi:MAG TPA: lipopolysaccharide biosynthesis protein [Ktedonobacteraceae bacterium]|nr:lipopolysaccharide biosynthesis protein [Ktedonobacteraceae bacterium]